VTLPAIFVATAYSWSCGATGPTKSGVAPVPHWTLAADPAVLPMGSIVRLEAPWVSGHEWMVHDTGSAIKGRRLDLMVSSCAQARWWGRRSVWVKVLHVGRKGKQ
jgi:3D (Asp-Asp-Asp) domain-containing protein